MSRVEQGLLILLLALPVVFGIRTLAHTLRDLGDLVERRFTAAPLERPWLKGAKEPVAYLLRTTPPMSHLRISLCGLRSVHHRRGIRYTLYPRNVEAAAPITSVSPDGLHVESCPGRWGAAPAAPDSWGPWPEGGVDLAPTHASGSYLLGILVPIRATGRPPQVHVWESGAEGSLLGKAPLIEGRAMLRRPVALRAEDRIHVSISSPGSTRPEVGFRADRLAIEGITCPFPPLTYLRFQAGRTVVVGADPTPTPSGDLPSPLRQGSSIFALAVPLALIILGLALTRRVPLKGPLGLRLALSWVLGITLFGAIDFVLGCLGASPAARVVAGATAGIVLSWGRRRWRPPQTVVAPTVQGDVLLRPVLVAVLSLALASLLFTSFLIPRGRGDSFGFWGMKSKAIYHEGSLTPRFLSMSLLNHDYPVLMPTVEAAMYRAAGGEADHAVALLGPITLGLAGWALASAVPGGLRPALRLLLAASLVLSPRMMHEAGGSLMDIHVAGFALISLILLERAAGSPGLMFVSGIVLGAGAFTKNDGIPFVAAGIVVPLLGRGAMGARARDALALLGGVMLVLGPWLAFRVGHGLSGTLGNEIAAASAKASPLDVAAQIVRAFAGMLPYALSFSPLPDVTHVDGGFLFVLAGLAMLARRRRLGSPDLFVGLAFLLHLVVWGLLPPERLQNLFYTTASRSLLQFYPCGLYLAARALHGSAGGEILPSNQG